MGIMIAGGKLTPVQVPARKVSQREEQVAPSTAGHFVGEETVRLSFRMQRGLHTRLKLEAVRQGRTIVSLLEGWVAEQTPLA